MRRVAIVLPAALAVDACDSGFGLPDGATEWVRARIDGDGFATTRIDFTLTDDDTKLYIVGQRDRWPEGTLRLVVELNDWRGVGDYEFGYNDGSRGYIYEFDGHWRIVDFYLTTPLDTGVATVTGFDEEGRFVTGRFRFDLRQGRRNPFGPPPEDTTAHRVTEGEFAGVFDFEVKGNREFNAVTGASDHAGRRR